MEDLIEAILDGVCDALPIRWLIGLIVVIGCIALAVWLA